jgi:hypothetical protein
MPNKKYFTPQQALEAFSAATSLETLPSGSYIHFLKSNLGPDELVEGINYILEEIFKTVFVASDELTQKELLKVQAEASPEPFLQMIAGLLENNIDLAVAADSGMRVAAMTVALDNNLNIE